MAKKPSRRRDGEQRGPDDDRAWASYSAAFRQDVMPKLLSSAVFLACYDGDGGSDQEIRFATELGMMLIYDKPIILTVMAGVTIPPRLARVADEIVEIDPDMGVGAQDRVVAAFRRVLAGLDRETGGD